MLIKYPSGDKIFWARITGGSGSSVTVTTHRNTIGATCTVTKTGNNFTLTFSSNVLSDASKCSVFVSSAFLPDGESYAITTGGRNNVNSVMVSTWIGTEGSPPYGHELGLFEILITIFN